MINFNLPRVGAWLSRTFPQLDQDIEERALRFGEEALELIQSLGVDELQAKALIQQVYGKPKGEPFQELGGTMVTLASLCYMTNLDADKAYETEFSRCEQPETIDKIRAKHAQKSVVSSRARLTRDL